MRRPYAKLYCHLVWATWDRLPLIVPGVELRLYRALATKVDEVGGTALAVGGMPDHVHCLCVFPPVLAISELVRHLKGSSSHLMTHELTPGEFFKWQGAYGAFTVGPERVEAVRRYVLDQKRHHADRSLWGEFEVSEDQREEPLESPPAVDEPDIPLEPAGG